jgi:UDP-GlcNAc:undecaprenyl-phosphate GlcNAc-1-phosphate transferase
LQPRADRWHRRPVAHFGGIAIISAFVIGALITGARGRLLAIVGMTLAIAIIGFCDDLRPWKPATKLLCEFVIAGLTVYLGVLYPVPGARWVSYGFTVVWIVGITNALNLLDNMDGLTAGIGIIASVALALMTSDVHLRILTLAFAASCVGFLLFNFRPAKIFMGDTGSLPIGYYLACASLLATEHATTARTVLFLPVLVLLVPVLDTLLVSVTRRLNGRAISVGARDHVSHRLVFMGLSERSAVLVLYAFGALSGGLALFAGRAAFTMSFAVLGPFVLVAALFWIRLARLKMPDEYLSRPCAATPASPERVRSMPAAVGTTLTQFKTAAAASLRDSSQAS